MTPPEIDPEILSGNKIVRTFRMPQELIHTLGREATHRGLDLTALVLRILQGYLTYFALPEAAIAQLEADRTTLKMDRTQYLTHILYHRCLALREQGLGFDDPCNPIPPKRLGSAVDGASSDQGSNELPVEQVRPLAKPLGAAGGGAHQASGDLLPGAGIWPIGVQKKPPTQR